MFNDAKGFKRIYLAVGYTDLRNGIEGLATIVKQQFCLDPYEKGVLFLFCIQLINVAYMLRNYSPLPPISTRIH